MSESPHHRRRLGLLCLALGLVTFGIYLPALQHDFLDYDDQQYVTENSHVRAGLTARGFAWAFGPHVSNWHPLTWLSHMLDCDLYGLRPSGHHLTNVLLHVGSTLLLFVVFRRMTGAIWRSACVAALFGWHPLHVESVAWVSERKDVLSAFFWMASLGAYAGYVGKVRNSNFEARNSISKGSDKQPRLSNPAIFYYLLAWSLFALGLMAKPMVVTLPFVLLLLDYWPLDRFAAWPLQAIDSQRGRRWTLWRLVREKLPFFALSVAASILTISAQRQSYSVVSTTGLPVGARIGHALLAYAHYLGATFVPRHLAAYYPYDTTVPASQVVLAGLLLTAITVLAIWWARRRPYLIFGWLWFLGTLVPVIGLVQVGDQAWADRYTYLPLIGVFVIVVWGGAEVMVKLESLRKLQTPGSSSQASPKVQAASPFGVRNLAVVLALLVAGALLALTARQLSYWQNTLSLFEHAELVTQKNHMAITLVGSLLARDGNLDAAIERYQRALSFRPGYAEAHFLLGNAYDQQGKLAEAIAEYQRAIGFKPTQEQVHTCLGVALVKAKRFDEAEAHYRAALKINPESAVAHHNLARLLQTQGRLDDAIEQYSEALRFDPALAQGHNNLGVLLLQKGRLSEGAAQLREALRLSPDNPETQYNLALALNQQQEWSEAAGLFARTVGSASTDPNAHYQFGQALAHQQKPRDAMSQYASALLQRPDFPEALDALAWILATNPKLELRNGTEAVRMAERSCELTDRKVPEKLKTLAAAYAEVGRFPEALTTLRTAREIAANGGRGGLAALCAEMATNFAATKPWREATPAPAH